MFRARTDYLVTEFRIPRSDEVSTLIEGPGIESLTYNKRFGGRYVLRLTHRELEKHRDVLIKLLRLASGAAITDVEDQTGSIPRAEAAPESVLDESPTRGSGP